MNFKVKVVQFKLFQIKYNRKINQNLKPRNESYNKVNYKIVQDLLHGFYIWVKQQCENAVHYC